MKLEYIQTLIEVYKDFEYEHEHDGMAGMVIDLKSWLNQQGELFCLPIDLSTDMEKLDIKSDDKLLLVNNNENLGLLSILQDYIFSSSKCCDLELLSSFRLTSKPSTSYLLYIFRNSCTVTLMPTNSTTMD